jgi:hypothetical protein
LRARCEPTHLFRLNDLWSTVSEPQNHPLFTPITTTVTLELTPNRPASRSAAFNSNARGTRSWIGLPARYSARTHLTQLRSCLPLGNRSTHPLERRGELPGDELFGQPEHPIPRPTKLRIPARIRSRVQIQSGRELIVEA